MSTKKKYALISVSDKKNLEDISRFLINNNFHIISTGGTYTTLKEMNIPVIQISDITNFPEIMDGRVKTLHPNVHAALLARKVDQEILNKLKIDRIDVLIVNFYPFESVIKKGNTSFEDAIENIDIGGPAMVRAAAKNYENCCVLTDVESYEEFMKDFNTNLNSNKNFNKKMSLKAFEYVASYDVCIANYLNSEINKDIFPKFYSLKKINTLRYGENPHQKSSLYQIKSKDRNTSIVNSYQHQGKELSYNNIVDGEAALTCAINFNEPACVIVKHANPCGVSISNNLEESYINAYATDPVSAFGGVIAFNKEVDIHLVKNIYQKQFVELIIAPKFSEEALNFSKSKENVRILEYDMHNNMDVKNCSGIKSLNDGILIQSEDFSEKDIFENYKIVSKKIPSKKELEDLHFAWTVSKYVKSNAIVFCKNKNTLGIGAGQMSRIDSTFIAAKKAKEQEFDLKNSVMASDAFFPFTDNVDKAGELKVSAIIQPGGSQNDSKVIDRANELNISLVFTGIRHFRH